MNELFSNPAVIWFLIGMAFLTLELVLPGLIVLFFGIGGWLVSLMILMMPEVSLNTQLLVFIIGSLVSLALLRKSLKKWIDGRKSTEKDDDLEEYIGKHCIAETDFVKGVGGKVSFKGALWNAESEKEIKKGDNLVITAVESIHLTVEPI